MCEIHFHFQSVFHRSTPQNWITPHHHPLRAPHFLAVVCHYIVSAQAAADYIRDVARKYLPANTFIDGLTDQFGRNALKLTYPL